MASVKSFQRSTPPGRGGPKVSKTRQGSRVALKRDRRGVPSVSRSAARF